MAWSALALLAAAAQVTPGTLLMDRNRADRAPPAAPLPRIAPIIPPRVQVEAAATSIKGIRFIGARAPAPVATAASRFLSRRATREVLTQLAAELSAAYRHANVALYTVAIPDQSFVEGVVVVHLTEGSISKVQLAAGGSAEHPLLRRRLSSLVGQVPLTRTTYERQLVLAQAIPGMTIQTDFQDPAANGELVLTATPKQRRSRVTAGYTNRGVDLLGDGQFDASISGYGVISDGDQATLSVSSSRDLRRYRYASASYAAVLSASGLSATGSAAYLVTRPRSYPVTGRAKQAGLALAYPLLRTFNRSVDASISVDGLNSDNAAFGSVIASERSRAVRAATSAVEARPRREVSASLAISRGIAGLGARTAARADFVKLSGSMSASQAIGKRLAARFLASGQWSPHALPVAERLAIGGEAIGRGFDTAVLTGDRGIAGLAELAWTPIGNGPLARSEVYAFGDAGSVSVRGPAGFLRHTFDLASAGVGVRSRYRDKAELGLEAAQVIDRPYGGYTEDWRLTVSWKLTL